MPGLDLLRAIAIVWVMLFHSYIIGGLAPGFEWLSRYGWMGVDLFFVLSGFLIGSQLLAPLADGKPLALKAFYLKRAFRILPAFAVVLALYLAVPWLRESDGMEPWWKFATFSVNLWIDYPAKAAFSHAWSLCVEEHFYLLFPWAAWLLTRKPSVLAFASLCSVIVVGGIALRSGIWLHNTALVDAGTPPQRNWFVEDIYYPTWCRLDGILAGVIIASIRVYRPRAWAWMQARGNLFLWLGLAVMAMALWLFRQRTGLLGNAVGWPVLSAGLALLVVAGASARSWIGRWSLPGMGWLAAASYSLYLTHKSVYHVVDTLWGEALQGRPLASFIAYASAILVAGAVLHYAVERPGLALRGLYLRRPRAAIERLAEERV